MGQTQSSPSSSGGAEPGARNRALARKEADLRKELSQKSQEAWHTNNKLAAKKYSNAAKLHQEAMERYNALAAAEIFKHHNPTYHVSSYSGASFFFGLFSGTSVSSALQEIDLHGLHVIEALAFVKEHLKLCRSNGIKRTTIITGKGLHSVNGVAKIRPQVEKMLGEERVKIVKGKKVNEGVFVVELAEEGEPVGWTWWLLGGLFGRG